MIFLQEVARDLHQQFGKDISGLALVFPNKRPAQYLRKWLGEILEGPVWSPAFLTIQEFILSSSNALPADKLIQQFLLFEAYNETMVASGEAPQASFEAFFSFSEILLNDFTELESNLAPIADVYTNLQQVELLEKGFDYLSDEQKAYLQRFWTSFSPEKMSRQQERFIHLWEKLPAIYDRLREKLHERRLINTGTAYRQLATGMHEKPGFDGAYEKLVFIGFNALNQAELRLFRQWKEEGRALFYFDADRYYTDDELQEAGRFIRRNIRLFGNNLPARNVLAGKFAARQENAGLRVIAVEGDAAQVRLVPSLLTTMQQSSGKGPQSSTAGKQPSPTNQLAVLLADETQLLPLLHSLPADQPVNVTMGYPLQRSLVFSLIRNWLQLQVSLTERNKQYFLPHLLPFLEHPWLGDLPEAHVLAKELQKGGNLVVPVKQVVTGHPGLQFWLQPAHNPQSCFEGIRSLLQWWAGNAKDNTTISRNLASAAALQLNRLESLLLQFDQYLSIPLLASIIQSMLGNTSVPLEANATDGIQVMGLLESRGLDFDAVILLQVNEGILPKRAAAPTFLPDSIRRAYQLSVLENQDSIFAYVFYRLFQHASQIVCTYNKTVTDQSTGEKSRFLSQLYHESGWQIQQQNLHLPLQAYWKPAITIPKNAEVLSLLKRFRMPEGKLTPTAINTYLDCRLKFFYQFLVRLREPDPLPEELDPRTVGLVLHRCLEMLYLQLAGHKGNNAVEPADIDLLLQWMEESVLDRAFAMELTGDGNRPYQFTGTLHLVRDIIAEYVKAILAADKAYAPFHMVSMEKPVQAAYSFSLAERRENIYIGGYIDRIDEKNGVYRIIDYKTGKDEKQFPSIESLLDRNNRDRNKAALQTLLYAWVLKQEKATPLSLETGLYDIRNMQHAETFDWRFTIRESRQSTTIDHHLHDTVEEALMTGLLPVLQEIFDPAVPFDQTQLVEKCQRCSFASLCGR